MNTEDGKISQIRTLSVNLGKGTNSLETVNTKDFSLAEKLGGVALAVAFFKNYLLKIESNLRDAFSEKNPICIDLGLLSGSNIMTGLRTFFSCLAPLKTSRKMTNGFFYSAVSGDFGKHMRSCGLDSIRIFERAPKPMMLVISENNTELVDASHLVGKLTHEKIEILVKDYPDSAFAVIGPAGEKLIRYANVAISTSDQIKNGSRNMRFAGRGGIGAVFGSKNLLAIVMRSGSQSRLIENAKETNHTIATNPQVEKYRRQGTFFANHEKLSPSGMGISDNFSDHKHPAEMKMLFEEAVEKEGYTIKSKGCLGCAVKCWKVIGDRNGQVLGKIDYEPGEALGTNLGLFHPDEIMHLIEIGDSYGLDTVSLGVAIGYAMEEENKFGNFEYAKKLAFEIAQGNHPLKEGVMRYGGSDHDHAMQVKGLEFPGYLGNINPGYAFAVAGLHTTMDTYNAAIQPGATNLIEEWVTNIMHGPQIMLYDLVGLCKFSKLDKNSIIEIFKKCYPDEMIDVTTLERAVLGIYFSIRKMDEHCGFTTDDEVLPARCHLDFHIPGLPHFNTKEFFNALKKRLYEEFAIY